MPFTIKNTTNPPRIVLLRLNSNKTLHLPPWITSTEIMDVEVDNNPMVKKLEA